MRRQRCAIGAVVQQADPVKLALAFPQVAAAMKTNLQTSIPLKDVDAWVTLALRVKKAKVHSIAFTSSVINTVRSPTSRSMPLVVFEGDRRVERHAEGHQVHRCHLHHEAQVHDSEGDHHQQLRGAGSGTGVLTPSDR